MNPRFNLLKTFLVVIAGLTVMVCGNAQNSIHVFGGFGYPELYAFGFGSQNGNQKVSLVFSDWDGGSIDGFTLESQWNVLSLKSGRGSSYSYFGTGLMFADLGGDEKESYQALRLFVGQEIQLSGRTGLSIDLGTQLLLHENNEKEGYNRWKFKFSDVPPEGGIPVYVSVRLYSYLDNGRFDVFKKSKVQ